MGNPSVEYPIDMEEASMKFNFQDSTKAQEFLDWWNNCGKSLWENKNRVFPGLRFVKHSSSRKEIE
jgi:hypothetical protein